MLSSRFKNIDFSKLQFETKIGFLNPPHEETDFEKKLRAMGVAVSNTGLGPIYTYNGITVASGIDEDTTIEKYWRLYKVFKQDVVEHRIGYYRKKYIQSVEMVNGLPVKKRIRIVYKKYNEDDNPDEFLNDLQIAVDTLKKKIPSFQKRCDMMDAEWFKHQSSRLLLGRMSWNELNAHKYGTIKLANGDKARIVPGSTHLLIIGVYSNILDKTDVLRRFYLYNQDCGLYDIVGNDVASFLATLNSNIADFFIYK